MAVLKHTLPYHHDSAGLFEKIAHEPWAMLLDSGQAVDKKTGEPGSQYGQYDIIVARPIATLVTNGSITSIQDRKPIISQEDPFFLLNQLLERYPAQDVGVPFSGGAMGYLGWNDNMDMAIAIRTAVIKNEKLYVQAGAGIVADSQAEMEWEETQNKARAIVRAVQMANNELSVE